MIVSAHQLVSEAIIMDKPQTDGGGVNTQYKCNKKQKMGTYAVNIYRWLIYVPNSIDKY
jgi:hypothetical protein